MEEKLMRRYILGITGGVMMLTVSGELRAQNSTCSSAQDCTQKWLSALNATKPDMDTIANFYSTDAVGVFSEGIFTSNTLIAKDLIAQVTNTNAPWKNIKIGYEQDFQKENASPWSYGCFSATVGGQAVNGYWSVVWMIAGGSWKMQQQTTTLAQMPISTLCPTAS